MIQDYWTFQEYKTNKIDTKEYGFPSKYKEIVEEEIKIKFRDNPPIITDHLDEILVKFYGTDTKHWDFEDFIVNKLALRFRSETKKET